MKYPDDYINKVICGDCLEIMKGIPDRAVDLVVTSPPYNLVREHSGGGPKSHYKTFHKRMLENWYPDDMPDEKYEQWQKDCIAEMRRICRGSVFYNHKIRYAYKRRGRTYHPGSLVPLNDVYCEIVWRMPRPGQNVPRFKCVDQRIFQIDPPVIWNGSDYETVWDIDFERDLAIRDKHPCPFPLEIPMRCIEPCTSPDHIVIDPFCGSGTTLVGAKQLGRRFIGIDNDSQNCETSEQRLAQEILL